MIENHVFWGFHIFSDGDSLVKQGFLALGWREMGDLSRIASTREAFKAKTVEAYGDVSHVANSAGQLFRFVHEMKEGDHVLYRSKIDRQIYLGTVRGPYEYRPDFKYCNVRKVEWNKTVPSTRFTQAALHELGSALTLFQVRNYAPEYQAALTGGAPATPTEDDDTVAFVADEVQQTTGDFILKELERHLKGHPFQGFVANLLETMGYRAHVNPKGPDEGIDIVAHRDELQLEPPIVKVQVKSGTGSVGGPDVRALFGNLGTGEYGLLVTLGTYAPQAIDFAKRKPNLRLISGDELVEFVLEHYEALDPRYKAIIPLKRVYIPHPVEQPGDTWEAKKTATAGN